MNFKKVKTQKLLKLALLYCPTVMVQSKQLLHIGTPKSCMQAIKKKEFTTISLSPTTRSFTTYGSKSLKM